MAFAAVGLQTHIWNNNMRSALLLLGFPLLLLLMYWAFFFFLTLSAAQPADVASNEAFGALSRHWPLVLGAATIWFMIAWFFHQNMINRATGARALERRENPRIYNMVENLCISRGMALPKLFIIESPVMNAYASGINEKTYAVTLTAGIIEALDDDELQAVIAHELTHIRNRDVRLLIVSIIFVGMISFFAEMAWRSMVYGRAYRSRGQKDGRVMLVAGIILAVGYVFAILIRFALSRKREFLADAGAVELTKNPDAMANALRKISGNAKLEGVPDDVRQMCIENPPGFFSLFATHPPIGARIAALENYAGATKVETEELPFKRRDQKVAAKAYKGPWT